MAGPHHGGDDEQGDEGLRRFRPGLLAAVLDRSSAGEVIRKAGIMSVVVVGGFIRPRDAIAVELPPLPHRPPERV